MYYVMVLGELANVSCGVLLLGALLANNERHTFFYGRQAR